MAIDTVTICYDDGVSGSEVCQSSQSLIYPSTIQIAASHSWSGTSNSQQNARLGWRFTVGANTIECNEFRFYNVDTVSRLKSLRMHRVSDGAQIAVLDTSGILATNQWHTFSVSTFELAAGVDYIVSSRNGGVNRQVARNPSSVTYDSAITYQGSYFGSDDNMPTSTTANHYQFMGFGYS